MYHTETTQLDFSPSCGRCKRRRQAPQLRGRGSAAEGRSLEAEQGGLQSFSRLRSPAKSSRIYLTPYRLRPSLLGHRQRARTGCFETLRLTSEGRWSSSCTLRSIRPLRWISVPSASMSVVRAFLTGVSRVPGGVSSPKQCQVDAIAGVRWLGHSAADWVPPLLAFYEGFVVSIMGNYVFVGSPSSLTLELRGLLDVDISSP
ncbi:hypothetical protein Nepgr_018047 [Nepenthes gracilis]|uniref:Uncharacterized protein n=1 Tax=Nepenthes gracilis TaxID=150966 RepID=A0AAD3SU21_NEPGR|nr:hypothetical protein Nepgr_018047 [Nepenthes gracilis]